MKLGDLSGKSSWPENGWHRCRCTSAKRVRPDTGTPYVRVEWVTVSGPYHFDDRLYLTDGARDRLALVLSRVCGYGAETELPDDPAAQLAFMAESVTADVQGREAMVKVVEKPDRQGILRKKVDFSGYRAVEDAPAPQPDDSPPPPDESEAMAEPEAEPDGLPF